MSFKRKLISAAATGFAAIAFTTFVSAQDTNTRTEDNSVQKQELRERRGGKRGFGGKAMRGGKHGGDKMMMRGFGKLNLTAAQQEQLRGLSENFKLSTQTQREELRALGMKRRDGIMTADEQARAKELRTQLKASSDQIRNTMLAILTPEQKAQLDQMKQEKKARREQFKQNRMNRQNQTTPQSEVN